MQQIKPFELSELEEVATLAEEGNRCWNCDEPCSVFSEYQDDARTFCSLDCLNEV